MAEQIEMWPVARLRAYERNTKKHPPEQIAALRASLKEFGFTMPILAREDGTIIAGHGRLQAAIEEGHCDVPVLVARGWSEAKSRAYTIADNRLAELASWDMGLLREELAALSLDDFNLDAIGFNETQLNDILGLSLEPEADDLTAPCDAEPISRRGDLWLLGEHRLFVGDATCPDDVEKVLAGAKPHLMVTDPPYGVEYDAEWRKARMPGTNPGKTGGMHGKVMNDDRADWREAYALFPGDVMYVWTPAGARQVEFFHSIEASGFDVRMQIVWAKSHFPIGRGDYHVKHEPCWYAVRKGSTSHWNGSRKQTTVWEIDKPTKSETGHSTQKPIECMRRPVLNNSRKGDAIYDPFLGSGTTLIVCELEKRVCYGLEINPVYADVIIKRWQEASGGRAVNGVTAEHFPG